MNRCKFTYFESETRPVCGVQFVPAPMHVYKDARYEDLRKQNSSRNPVLVCSYKCQRESERLFDEIAHRRMAERKPKYKMREEMQDELQNTAKAKDT